MLNLTYNEMLSAYSTYPAPIRPYQLRAETHPVLREKFTKSMMRAFIDLLARANITNPARPIQVRVDLTAERLGISSKTVSRTIEVMRKNAWLATSTTHDGRNWRGEYAGREFILSNALRKLVGLPIDAAEGKPNDDANASGGGANSATAADLNGEMSPNGQDNAKNIFDQVNEAATEILTMVEGVDNTICDETKMSDGEAGYPQKTDQKSGNQTKMSDGHIGVNNGFIKKEAPFKAEALLIENEGEKPIRIPADLADMHTVFGISGKGICGLMRLAKDKCQRLQNIWKTKKEQLKKAGATGGRAVLYLRSLLLSGEDFAYIARNMLPNPGDEALPPAKQIPAADGQPCTNDTCSATKASDRVLSLEDMSLYDISKFCAFKKFRHVTTGMVVRFYDGTADVSQGLAYAVYAGWDMMRNLYLGVKRGNLVEVTA